MPMALCLASFGGRSLVGILDGRILKVKLPPVSRGEVGILEPTCPGRQGCTLPTSRSELVDSFALDVLLANHSLPDVKLVHCLPSGQSNSPLDSRRSNNTHIVTVRIRNTSICTRCVAALGRASHRLVSLPRQPHWTDRVIAARWHLRYRSRRWVN
jgi:hypothetical protein